MWGRGEPIEGIIQFKIGRGYIHGCRVGDTYQNGYSHGSPSKFSAKSAIYTAAGWESMYQNGYLHGSPSKLSATSAIYTAAGCQHIIAIYTAAVPEQIHTTAVCSYKIAIYTAAIQEPNRLYTLMPGVYKNRYLHGSGSRAKSAKYIAAGCIEKNVIYTAAV